MLGSVVCGNASIDAIIILILLFCCLYCNKSKYEKTKIQANHNEKKTFLLYRYVKLFPKLIANDQKIQTIHTKCSDTKTSKCRV